ncbi:MAG TPA: FkbM family methyltransferase, partial [Bacteroidales bacterium]|nr:FkbM family methyltransferase [Bacteroidales bacterium]
GIIYDSLKSNILSVTVNRNLYPDNNFYPVEIETIQLDTFISNENLTRIDLIKIDVETHEIEVLEGFKNFLMKFQPTILIEVLTEEIAQRLNEIFQGKDYYYFNIDESKGLIRVDQIIKCDGFNFLLCKKGMALKSGLI